MPGCPLLNRKELYWFFASRFTIVLGPNVSANVPFQPKIAVFALLEHHTTNMTSFSEGNIGKDNSRSQEL